MPDQALQRRLFHGQNDPRGPQGEYSRGANVYNGSSSSAHSGGGPQFGRPRTNPVQQQQGPDLQSFFQNLQQGNQPVDMNPKPVNPLIGAIQRRLGGKA